MIEKDSKRRCVILAEIENGGGKEGIISKGYYGICPLTTRTDFCIKNAPDRLSSCVVVQPTPV